MEKFYVGVDVGGTSIKMGMFSHTGELLEKWEIPTRVDEDEQTDRILPDIAVSIEEKRSGKKWKYCRHRTRHPGTGDRRRNRVKMCQYSLAGL